MDGKGFSFGNKNAQNLTAEIDQATNLLAPELTESQVNALKRDQAIDLGNKILTSNIEQTTNAQEIQDARNNKAVMLMAERNNGYGNQIEENPNRVGEEGKEQIQEHIRDDEEDAANEEGRGGKIVFQIIQTVGKKFSKSMSDGIASFMNQSAPNTYSFEQAYNDASRNYQEQAYGRKRGDRNV